MEHSVEIVNTKQLTDGLLAVQARCCGDVTHTSWHTMAAEVAIDPVRRADSISWHINRVAQLHETALQALTILPTLIGTVTTITVPAPADPAPATAPSDPSGQNPGA